MDSMHFPTWTSSRFAKALLATVVAGAAINAMSPNPKRPPSMERHIRTIQNLAEMRSLARNSQRTIAAGGRPDHDLFAVVQEHIQQVVSPQEQKTPHALLTNL